MGQSLGESIAVANCAGKTVRLMLPNKVIVGRDWCIEWKETTVALWGGFIISHLIL